MINVEMLSVKLTGKVYFCDERSKNQRRLH